MVFLLSPLKVLTRLGILSTWIKAKITRWLQKTKIKGVPEWIFNLARVSPLRRSAWGKTMAENVKPENQAEQLARLKKEHKRLTDLEEAAGILKIGRAHV